MANTQKCLSVDRAYVLHTLLESSSRVSVSIRWLRDFLRIEQLSVSGRISVTVIGSDRIEQLRQRGVPTSSLLEISKRPAGFTAWSALEHLDGLHRQNSLRDVRFFLSFLLGGSVRIRGGRVFLRTRCHNRQTCE